MIGKLLNWKMRDMDTPERVAERARHRKACERAVREREEKFPSLTAENAAEAMRWQEKRIAELTA